MSLQKILKNVKKSYKIKGFGAMETDEKYPVSPLFLAAFFLMETIDFFRSLYYNSPELAILGILLIYFCLLKIFRKDEKEMKTRVLGLLLLVAMLITAIPVMTAAAEEANLDAAVSEQSASETKPELYTLYTDRGLVALYTAFSDDGSVDLENGTWANKVAGGEAAILRDESTAGNYWTKYSMGIGYAMTYAQWKTSLDARKVGISLSESYNTDEFTVETFAKLVGITNEDGTPYVYSSERYVDYVSAFRFDLAGCLFFGNLRNTVDSTTGEVTGEYYRYPGQVKWLGGVNNCLSFRWYVQNFGFAGRDVDWDGKGTYLGQYFKTGKADANWMFIRGSNSSADTDHRIPVAGVFQFTKTSVESDDRASASVTYSYAYNNAATYGSHTVSGTDYDTIAAIERNGASFKVTPTAGTAYTCSPLEYADPFSLFNGVPGEVYAIRVYDSTLTDPEKAQNRLIDLLYYYGVDVPARFFEEGVLESTLSAVNVNSIVLSSDASKTAANKSTLEDAIESAVVRYEIMERYAAPEDLVAFFTAYDKTTVDLTAGTWTDIIDGSVATLEGKTNWTFRENGSIGFDAWGGYMKDGVYTVGKDGFAGATTAFTGNKYRLVFDIHMLPDEDFTVEYLATYRPVLIADANKTASGGAVVYYQEDGKDVAAYDYAVANGINVQTAGNYIPDASSGIVNDIFGFFGAFTRIMDGPAGWITTPRGSMWWSVAMSTQQNPTYQQFLISHWTPVSDYGFTKSVDPYHVTGGKTFNTYTASVDETVVGEHTEALFTIYRDAAKYADNSAAINSTANNAAADVAKHADTYYYYVGSDDRIYYLSDSLYYDDLTDEVKPDTVTVGARQSEKWGTAYYDCDYTELKGLWGNTRSGFWLSAGTPTDFLNVRVYKRALAQTELAQNRLADILMYYGIELDSAYLNDPDFVSELMYTITNFTEIEIATDASKQTATETALEAEIAKLVGLLEDFNENDYASLYVTEGANGATLDALFTTFGNPYNVDLASGVWKNEVEGGADATFRDTGSQKYWQRASKGVGYTMNYKTLIYRTSAGSNVGTDDYVSPNNDWDEVGLKLSDSYASYENFTVESFATVVGATGDDGKRWEHIAGQKYAHLSNFRFGLLGSCTFQGLTSALANEKWVSYYYGGPYDFGGYSTQSLTIRWSFSNSYVSYLAGRCFDDTQIVRAEAADQDHRIAGASVMQIEKSTNGTENVLYTIKYNGKAQAGSQTVAMSDYKSWSSAAYGAIDQKTGIFSMFNALPATIYAIRLYDGILTAAEKTQNRLADLMYYHDVEIPVGLADNAEALAAIAPVADTVVLSTDAAKTAANKATIEAAIAGALPTVTITVGGEEVEKVAVATATYTLPATLDGKAVVAYTIGETPYFPGATVTLGTGITAEAVLVDAPKTQTKAGLRLAESADQMGLRFIADLSLADFNTIKALYGIDAITVGMLITPVKYVEYANGVFTREALDKMVAERNGQTAGYVQIVADGFYTSDETSATIAGSIYNFSANTKAKNPAFTAVAFIDIDAGVDGEVDFTVYGNYDPAVAVRVTDIATSTRPTLGATQRGWIDNLLAQFQG